MGFSSRLTAAASRSVISEVGRLKPYEYNGTSATASQPLHIQSSKHAKTPPPVPTTSHYDSGLCASREYDPTQVNVIFLTEADE